MSICASICLTVSSATPTTMMTEVPPRATLERFVEIAPTISGTRATMPRNTAPTKVTLPSALVMKSLVGLPGRKPGMKPPFFFRLLAISIGLNWMDA